MSILDGRAIAEEMKIAIRAEIDALGATPVLAVVVVGDVPETEQFIRIKKKVATEIGVLVEEHRFSEKITTDDLTEKVENLAIDPSIAGIVVQLPLPHHIDRDAILGAIPATKDVDVISQEGVLAFESGAALVPPPVLGAMMEVLRRELVPIHGKNVVVVGQGMLVGKPAKHWFLEEGGLVQDFGRQDDIAPAVKRADILVLGAGSPGLISKDMVKEGVVILDAGTSEEAGKLQGDADYQCSEVASVFTPVPGGIGPITVAVLFQNLITLLVHNAE